MENKSWLRRNIKLLAAVSAIAGVAAWYFTNARQTILVSEEEKIQRSPPQRRKYEVTPDDPNPEATIMAGLREIKANGYRERNFWVQNQDQLWLVIRERDKLGMGPGDVTPLTINFDRS